MVHRLFGPAELVVGPRLLVEDLVVVLVRRIGREDLLVRRNGLARTRQIHVRSAFRQLRGVGLITR